MRMRLAVPVALLSLALVAGAPDAGRFGRVPVAPADDGSFPPICAPEGHHLPTATRRIKAERILRMNSEPSRAASPEIAK